jgi:hypothetical protein
VDLFGALSNQSVQDRLAHLAILRQRLLNGAPATVPPIVRPAARAGDLLQAITAVLEEAGQPTPVAEIRQGVKQRLGRPVNPGSVKACLSECAFGPSPRFKRLKRGVYRLVIQKP